MIAEPAFPRGGTVKKAKKEDQSDRKEVKYGVRTDEIEKKIKPSKRQRKAAKIKLNDEQSEQLIPTSANIINRFSVVEGMLLLGVINSIEEMQLRVSLPGKMHGLVPITAISDPYSKLLKKVVEESSEEVTPLASLFKKGQYVCVKVMNVERNKNYITLSLNPTDINAEKHHSQLVKGLVTCAAVSDVEDHGYTLDIGIKNVRAFLPKEKTKIKFHIGSIVYGCIDEASSSATTSTVILKTNKSNDIGMLEMGDTVPVLDMLIPGTFAPFTMKKVLKNGLSGTIFDTFDGFVNENYLTEAHHRPNDYTIGLQFETRILYVTPLTKHVALTMNFSKVRFQGDDGILPIGHVVEEAVSLGKSGASILFKLNKTSKGAITLKTIKARYKGNYDERSILSQYDKTTKHRLKIVKYDPFERIYACTDNEHALQEPYFSINDLTVGEIVQGKVVKILKEAKGCCVKIGRVKGYMYNIDCAGTNLKKNATIKVRVISLNHETNEVLVTNRTEFLKTKNILTNVNQVVPNLIFTGIIVKETPVIYLVRFFNKIKGVLYKNPALTGNTELREGAIMDFRVVNAENDKIILKIARDFDSFDHLGTVVSAKIECLLATGAQIIAKKSNITGTVPIKYFSDFTPLSEPMYNAMKEGQKIKAVNLMNQIFSVRDVEYYSKNPPLTFDEVQVGSILKGFVKNYKDSIVEIKCLLKDFHQTFKLHINKMLLNPLPPNDPFELPADTVIYVRVMSKVLNPKSLNISAKLEDVWNGSPDAGVDLMQKYFNAMNLIKTSCEEKQKPIAGFRVGQKTSGTVTDRFEAHDILVLTLENGVSGLCRNVSTKNYKVGDQVEGKVVWIDYIRQVVDIVISPQAMLNIQEDQEVSEDFLKQKQKSKGHVVLVRDDVIIVSIGNKGPLVYLAPRFHMNDYQPSMISSLATYRKCTVHLLKVVEGKLIGMFEENFKHCQTFMKIYEQKNSKIDEKVNAKRKRSLENNVDEVESESIEREPGSLLRIKPMEDDEAPPKKKKKKHIKAVNGNKTGTDSPAVQVKGNKKKQKNTKGSKNNGEKADIENLFANQLDGAVDCDKSEKKNYVLIKKKKTNFVSLKSVSPTKKNKKQKNQEQNVNIHENNSKKRKQKDEKCEKPNKIIKGDHVTGEVVEDPIIKTVKNKKLFSMKIHKASKPESNAKSTVHELPGAEGFWSEKSIMDTSNNDDNDSVDQEDETTKGQPFNRNSEPKSIRDFDRLLMLTPDDSKLWIKYINFHMKAFEIEKAKGVGQRAIKVINYRKEKEKLNVWIELLKIEIHHGTNDSFNELFREAILRNQPLHVYSKTFKLLIEAEKFPQVNGLLGNMMKKYKPHEEMWQIAAETYYQIQAPDKAKELLERAYKSLPKDKHMQFTVKFALLSNKYRQQEFAQALLENILTSYPAKVDIWFQYVDMLIKDKLFEFARSVLDRAVIQRLPIRKTKSLYQKYVEFEEKYGTPEHVKKIKLRAAEYVKKITDDIEAKE